MEIPKNRFWIAYNGWLGGTTIGCIVQATTETAAKEIASSALETAIRERMKEQIGFPGELVFPGEQRTEEEVRDYSTVTEIEEITLPWVGEVS